MCLANGQNNSGPGMVIVGNELSAIDVSLRTLTELENHLPLGPYRTSRGSQTE